MCTFFSTLEKLGEKKEEKTTFCFLVNQTCPFWEHDEWSAFFHFAQLALFVNILPLCTPKTICYGTDVHGKWEASAIYIHRFIGILLPGPLCSSELAEDSDVWEGWSLQRQSEQPRSLRAPAGSPGQCWQRSLRLVQHTQKCTRVVGTLFRLIHQTR